MHSRWSYSRWHGVGLIMIVCSLVVAVRAHASPALWGNLRSGPYNVGFKAVFVADRSRTWRVTRSFSGTFKPDIAGKPIQLDIWFPAAKGQPRKLRFGDYLAPPAPPAFAELRTLMAERSRADIASAVTAEQLPRLLAQPMAASPNAKPAPGRFPVILYFGGLNAPIDSNSILGEYLASRGYIFAAISLLGVSDQHPFQSTDPAGLETTVRDMEYAASVLPRFAPADMGRIAVMGHSIGAIEAAIFAARHGNVVAMVGFDGTYGFQGSTGVLNGAYGYAPRNVRAAVLDLRRPEGEQSARLDMSAIEAMRYSDRSLMTVPHMHHSDFTSFAMIGRMYHTPVDPSYAGSGWNRETGASGFETVGRTVAAFLDARVKGDAAGWAKMTGASIGTKWGSVRHLDAAKVPPTPMEMAGYAAQHGREAAEALVLESCDKDTLADCVNAGDYNSLGYRLLGQGKARDGLTIFQLAVWAYPASANLQDSLADGYLAVGDTANAKKAIQRAIELATSDPSLNDSDRAGFIAAEAARLKQFQ
jgi:dienelactone hydrolase